MGEEEPAVRFKEAEATAERHKSQGCPEEDTRKRIIDLVFEGGARDGQGVYRMPDGSLPLQTFQCRGCNWSITEEPTVTDEEVKMLRWRCDECGGSETDASAGVIPEGWDVDDVDDLETCCAVCPECVTKGLSAS